MQHADPKRPFNTRSQTYRNYIAHIQLQSSACDKHKPSALTSSKTNYSIPKTPSHPKPVYRACYVRPVHQCSVRLRQSAQQTSLHSIPKSMTGKYNQLASHRNKFNDCAHNHPVYIKHARRLSILQTRSLHK
jgi:hypothetical protein